MKKVILSLALLILITNAFAIKPIKEYISKPSIYYEEYLWTTDDGMKIKSWYLEADPQLHKGITIIISYGDYGNMSYWVEQAMALSKNGFDVFTYDYRGFGESGDFVIDNNMLYYPEFALDLKCVIEQSKQMLPTNEICLLSYSMGTIISINLINQRLPIDYYIAEGQVYSPHVVQKRLAKSGKQIQIPNEPTKNETIYKNIHIPFLIFQGMKDPICTEKDSQKIQKLSKKVSIEIFNGNHLQGFYVLEDKYIQVIKNFLQKK